MGQMAHNFFVATSITSIQLRLKGDINIFYQDRALKTIVRNIDNTITGDPMILAQQVPDVDELASPANRPDLVIFSQIASELYVDVYELKPIASAMGYKHNAAEKQLNGYIAELTNAKLPTRGGDQVITGMPLPFPEVGDKATITFTADPLVKGLYYYKIDDGMEK
jgi:hypothetical protein